MWMSADLYHGSAFASILTPMARKKPAENFYFRLPGCPGQTVSASGPASCHQDVFRSSYTWIMEDGFWLRSVQAGWQTARSCHFVFPPKPPVPLIPENGRSTGRLPMRQPPGRLVSTCPRRASSGPRSMTEDRICPASISGILAPLRDTAEITRRFSSIRQSAPKAFKIPNIQKTSCILGTCSSTVVPLWKKRCCHNRQHPILGTLYFDDSVQTV